jgi:lipopolysaccharide/colanic/teichoic acid biosynthesis glycosyltransferase
MTVKQDAFVPSSVAVIITARRPGADLGKCVAALQQGTVAACAIYAVGDIDGGTTADFPDVTVIPHQNPVAGRNKAIEASSAEIVCFLDADCVPAVDWMAQICAPFSDSEVVGCKGVYATHKRGLIPRFVQLEYEDKYNQLATQSQIDFIDTYSAAYRRDLLLANGGFDERFAFLEDQELSFRLAARGYKLVFRPNARVYLEHVYSLPEYLTNKFQIGFWKAQVVRRFPTRGVRDSHTPQVAKLQIILTALLLLSGASVIVAQWGVIAFALFAATLLMTMLPFTVRSARRDWQAALIAPFMLLLRALGLGFGYGWGILRPQKGITGAETTIGGWSYLLKRGMDIVGGLLGMLFLIVLGPWLALGIKLDSAGPILFKQERIGQGGVPFAMYKFRSMSLDAELQLTQLVDFAALDEPVFKLEDDPRVTRFGRFMRRWSLDELPQFWNVLRGQMSLVGPRPEETRIVALYNDWHRRRLAVKPGLSGPMQVGGRGDLALDRRVRLELDYIENYSLRRDLRILLGTIPAVIRGDGAH